MTLQEMAAQYDLAAERIQRQIDRWRKDPDKKVHLWRLYQVREEMQYTADYLRRYYQVGYVYSETDKYGPHFDYNPNRRDYCVHEYSSVDGLTKNKGRAIEAVALRDFSGADAESEGNAHCGDGREKAQRDSERTRRVLLDSLQDLS